MIDYGVGVVYFYYNFGAPIVGALAITTAGYLVATYLTRDARMQLRASRRDRQDRTAGIKNDSLSLVELVKYSSGEAYEASRYLESVIDRQRANFDYALYYRTYSFSQGLIMSTGSFVRIFHVERC